MNSSKAILALCVAIGLPACAPAPQGSRLGPLQLDLLARSIAQQEGLISAEALADRLIQDPDGLLLVDLRAPEAFAEHHIDGARNLPVTALTDPESLGDPARSRQAVLYSEDSTTAARAQSLLQLAGREALLLEGGWQAWQAHLHGVDAPPDPTAQAKRQAVACFFEGDYLADAGLTVKTPAPAPTLTQARSGGYMPPLQPVEHPTGGAAALGLGLELGLGPERRAETRPADSLGLGLGLGLGPKKPQAAERPALIVGEGC